jgi:tetratricopeptide (TPR) repeat protein
VRLQYFFCVILILSFTSLLAQKSVKNQSFKHNYDKGISLFEQEKYVPAQNHFRLAMDDFSNLDLTLRAQAQFYHAICAVRLFHNDAEYLVSRFIYENPDNIKIKDAYFELAREKFNKEKYADALKWLDNLDWYGLNDTEKAEYFFKKGYSYFQLDSFAQARVAFYEIIHKKSEYFGPANYYYAHIAYEQKNYQTALNGFTRIKEDVTFAPVVPYYLIQVYYILELFDSIIIEGPNLFEAASPKRKAEVARIIGEAFYNKQIYDSAVKYLEFYAEADSNLSLQDKYKLAFAYYRINSFDKAAPLFEQVSLDTTALSQNAVYHLADCYLQLNEKEKARTSFYAASRLNYDTIIKRDALFNFAMASYELGYSPFNEAIDAFTGYINTYPQSEKVDVAFRFLVLSYMHTKNYKDAIRSIEKIKHWKDDMREAYQRITYFRGLEVLVEHNFAEAIDLLSKSLTHSKFDPIIKTGAYYWRAESYYRSAQYQLAISDYKNYLESMGAFDMPYYNDAHYGIAYANYNQKNYAEASLWFRKYIAIMGNVQSDKLGDALNRTGDCYFVSSNYTDALDFYNKAIKQNTFQADYATFQKGFILGILQRYQEKVDVLRNLSQQYLASHYIDDAYFEIGRSFQELNLPDSAILYYNKLLTDYPKSSYKAKALTQLGLVYYNTDRYDEALEVYKQVISDFKGTDEEQNALLGVKNIYMAQNNVGGYVDYVKTAKVAQEPDFIERDSLSYLAAQNIYMRKEWEKASKAFLKYLADFPDGRFITNANYYLADCNNRLGLFDKAIPQYKYIADKPKSVYSEDALYSLAKIYYQQEDYLQAQTYFDKLIEYADNELVKTDATLHSIRSKYKLRQYKNTIDAAKGLIKNAKISDDNTRELNYYIASSYYYENNYNEAMDFYKTIALEVKSKYGAEAKYRVIEILYSRKDLKETRKEIMDYIDMNTPHRYWLAKSFLIFVDVLLDENDEFQALHTVRSLLDNYNIHNDGIVEQAKEKEKLIMEKQKSTK